MKIPYNVLTEIAYLREGKHLKRDVNHGNERRHGVTKNRNNRHRAGLFPSNQPTV